MLMSVVCTTFDFLSGLDLLPLSPLTSLCHLHIFMWWKYLIEWQLLQTFNLKCSGVIARSA